jgi:hypothetical protein
MRTARADLLQIGFVGLNGLGHLGLGIFLDVSSRHDGT